MQIKDIVTDKKDTLVHIFDSAYYIPVYKKTEKIVCAVFFITERTKETQDVHDIVSDTRRTAVMSLRSVIDFLGNTHTRAGASDAIAHLSSLRSLLHVLATVRIIRSDFLPILVHEIDTVLAHLSTRYDEGAAEAVLSEDSQPSYVAAVGRDRVRRVPREGAYRERPRSLGMSTSARSETRGRRESIQAIIKEKGAVSIKDISDIIKDVSEKTIQRELIEMIKDGLVLKEGERRWSRYKLTN